MRCGHFCLAHLSTGMTSRCPPKGTLLGLGEVVLFPAILHVTRGRHADTPGLSSKQFCICPLKRRNTEEEDAFWWDFSNSQYQYWKNVKSSKGGRWLVTSHHLALNSPKYENPAGLWCVEEFDGLESHLTISKKMSPWIESSFSDIYLQQINKYILTDCLVRFWTSFLLFWVGFPS